MPLPLNHSKLTFGYLLETAHSRVTWPSDIVGLPDEVLKSLHSNQPQVIIIDCSHVPCAELLYNHCGLNAVIVLSDAIHCPRVILTYIDHQFDLWMTEHPLPVGLEAGYSGMKVMLE